MTNFLNSKWFLIVKSALLAAALWLTQQDGMAHAQLAAGQPVTAVDLPASFVPALAIVYGLLQSGQEKPK